MPDAHSPDWDPIEALKSLVAERALSNDETPVEQAKRLFGENLPLAVLAICHMATYSPIEAIRFNAAKYVVDRTMGPSERGTNSAEGRRVWDDLYEQIIDEASNYLKKD